jgi:exonuclease III
VSLAIAVEFRSHLLLNSATWFNRRARGLDAARVDYVLVSSDLVSRVLAAGILDLLSWSDHAPVVVEL